MSWFPERQQRTWLQRLCEGILKTGPIPKHVAFIMDGNRRFAVKQSIDRAEGHLKGFDKLAEVHLILYCCLVLSEFLCLKISDFIWVSFYSVSPLPPTFFYNQDGIKLCIKSSLFFSGWWGGGGHFYTFQRFAWS